MTLPDPQHRPRPAASCSPSPPLSSSHSNRPRSGPGVAIPPQAASLEDPSGVFHTPVHTPETVLSGGTAGTQWTLCTLSDPRQARVIPTLNQEIEGSNPSSPAITSRTNRPPETGRRIVALGGQARACSHSDCGGLSMEPWLRIIVAIPREASVGPGRAGHLVTDSSRLQRWGAARLGAAVRG